MKSLLLFISLLLLQSSLYAQLVEGVVTDSDKNPLIGATVMLNDTSLVAVTNLEGRFSIDVDNLQDDILTFSYIGFSEVRHHLQGERNLTIVMSSNNIELEEIVAIGYGSMRRSDLTGAISSVEIKDEDATRAVSFDQLLKGRVAGLQVMTGSAAPGGSVSLRIRGTTSLQGDNEPLYVVDGYIMDNDDMADPMSTGTGGENSRMDAQNPLASISPQDIESIEILKDASATAIYGSRAANGVVIITTKRGDGEKPTVSASANFGVAFMKDQIDVLSSSEFIDYCNAFKSGTPLSMDDYTAVNWQDYATRPALSQNYRVSVSGGNKGTNYYIAGGYIDQQGIIKNTGTSRYDFRVNLDKDIGDKVSISSRTFYSRVDTQMTSSSDQLSSSITSIVKQMVLFRPLRDDMSAVEWDEDDEAYRIEKWFTDFDDDTRDVTFNTNLSLDVKPTSWLTFRLDGSLAYRDKERSKWYGAALSNNQSKNGKAGISTTNTDSYRTNALAIISKSFAKKHKLNATFGVEYSSKAKSSSSVTGEDFVSQDLRVDGIGGANIIYPYKLDVSNNQMFSALSRVLYSYDNRYSLTATFRADGSSKFAEGNRFAYFPSFATAWRINEEPFLKDVRMISNLKLRAGWGQVGNQAVRDYQTMMTYDNNTYSNASGSSIAALESSLIPNPDLKWETTSQYNVGVDVGLFGHRLLFTADAYLKDTDDLLQKIDLGSHTGFTDMWINSGSIRNMGLELAVSGVALRNNDWELSLGGNISFSKNEITSLGMAESDFGTIKNVSGYYGDAMGGGNFKKNSAVVFIEGYPIQYIGYQTCGIMQQEEYAEREATGTTLSVSGVEVEPGHINYVDQNGDNKINGDDMVIIGNPLPNFVYGLNASLSYKRLSLYVTLDGVYGNDLINANLFEEYSVDNSSKNVRREAFYEAWTPENRSNTFPVLGYDDSMGLLTDRYVQDGSYLRLSNVTLSYAVPVKRLKGVKSLTLSFTANDLFCITSYNGYNPDVSITRDLSHLGIDMASYPSTRQYYFNIIANF